MLVVVVEVKEQEEDEGEDDIDEDDEEEEEETLYIGQSVCIGIHPLCLLKLLVSVEVGLPIFFRLFHIL